MSRRMGILVSQLSNRTLLFFFSCYGDRRDLHSFPTRRSSDLRLSHILLGITQWRRRGAAGGVDCASDRKSTRLNSSHVESSYAVFCLKKKTPAAVLTMPDDPLLHQDAGRPLRSYRRPCDPASC